MGLCITVLDYAIGGIRVYHLTDVPVNKYGYADLDVETWLYDNDPGYKEATCHYICNLEKPEVEYNEG